MASKFGFAQYGSSGAWMSELIPHTAKIADDAPGPEEVLLESEARDALDATLADMTDDLRVVLVLVEIEGLSVADLAASLDVPAGTAASRLRRAREAFTASARRVRARLEWKGAER